jgi:predicted transcriptional regulator
MSMQVLALHNEGQSVPQIATQLAIRPTAVQSYLGAQAAAQKWRRALHKDATLEAIPEVTAAARHGRQKVSHVCELSNEEDRYPSRENPLTGLAM